VQEDDTAATLAARVFDQEKQAYPEAIRLFHAGRLKIEGRQVKVLPPAAEVSAAAPVEAPAEEKS
jgi:folate-dependent phosphoribosylglycinamide formyltransferase PurN